MTRREFESGDGGDRGRGRQFFERAHVTSVAVLSAILALFILTFVGSMYEWNSDKNLQVCEYPGGDIRAITKSGIYYQGFGDVYTYPRNIDIYLSAKPDEGTSEDTSIEVTFSDAGKASTSHVLKLTLPTSEDALIKMHRHFGKVGVPGIKHSVAQHLMTCLKISGPMMSASEFQMQRQAEFYKTVRQ